MLKELNTYQKQLQILTSVNDLFPSKTTPCPSANIVPAMPAMPSGYTLESMPPEILDRIASFVSASHDILRLCHTVRYFKYISKAMFDFASAFKPPRKPVDLWPRIKVETVLYTIPPLKRQLLGAYSRILSKHGGSATIKKSFRVEAILGVLPQTVEVLLNNSKDLPVLNRFLAAVGNAKKNVGELTFGEKYFKSNGECGPVLLNLTTDWLSILPIHVLRFNSVVPTEILGMFHLAPKLGSLHLPRVENYAGVALSKCKLLRKLSVADVFDGRKSPEELVQQVVNIVEGTKIQQVEVVVPKDCKIFPRRDLTDLATTLFLQHGWHKRMEYLERMDQHASMYFVCPKL
ncbi:hypothetical protein BJ741DRAFT_619533 [Chytriomyces cf. hyalinus JEL632]|nr:hypothetical protein BJ741DRAFT_619533 [Chytriomyces cf. hyalinus JEL632]